MAAPAASTPALALAVSRSGLPRLVPASSTTEALAGPRAMAVQAAFERGSGAGVLHLGSVEVGTELPPAFAYYRDLGHDLRRARLLRARISRLSARSITVEPPPDRLEHMAAAAPPMLGAEYVTVDACGPSGARRGQALAAELPSWRGPIADWLRAKNAAWATVGRVCFHLAENKRDPEAPFAFLATYTTRLSAQAARPSTGRSGTPSRSAARDARPGSAARAPPARPARRRRRARSSARWSIGGDIYHPLAWTPREAHAFLKEVPALEAAGVVVRVPDWWSVKAPPRPEVQVTVGAPAPSQLATDAMLDFSVELALDGDPLSAEERRGASSRRPTAWS